MNKLLWVLLIVILGAASGCKSGKKVETTSSDVTMLSAKKALKAIADLPTSKAWVNILADVTVNQNGDQQSAAADVRLRQDSIVWVELSDKIIGIKAIRAFAMADTVAYYNRIERNYFAGSYDYVEKKLGTSLPFNYIFQVFQGQLFINNGQIETLNNHYILTAKDENQNSFMAEIEPLHFDCLHQEFITKTDVVKIFYADYKEIDGFRYPHTIKIEVRGKQSITADFTVKSINTKGPFKTTFSISNKYERVK